MVRFIDREDELEALETACQMDSFQMAVVYGRRRIGKTTLLRQFCKDKKRYSLLRSKRRRIATLNCQ